MPHFVFGSGWQRLALIVEIKSGQDLFRLQSQPVSFCLLFTLAARTVEPAFSENRRG